MQHLKEDRMEEEVEDKAKKKGNSFQVCFFYIE